MTKDELRAMLSTLVPEAIASGRAYRINTVGSGKAKLPLPHESFDERVKTGKFRVDPNSRPRRMPVLEKVAVATKPAIPAKIDPATQRKVRTTKPFAPTAEPYLATVAENAAEKLSAARREHMAYLRACRRKDAEEAAAREAKKAAKTKPTTSNQG